MKYTIRLLQRVSCITRQGLSALLVLLISQNNSIAQSPGGVSSGLTLWLKGNAGTTVSGSTVTAWKDQSPKGFNMSQGTYTGPTLTANACNFNQGLLFTNNFLSLAAPGIFTSGASYNNLNYYVVYNSNNSSTFHWLIYQGAGTGFTRFSHSFNYGGGTSGDLDAPTPNRLSYTTSNNQPLLVSYLNSTTAITGSSLRLLYLNGGAIASGTSYSPFVGPNNPFQIGANNLNSSDGGASPFSGYVHEIIFYTSANSIAQKQQIESYLALKYGISLGSTASPVNYVSSNGTTFWTGNTSYQNDIFGIGTDNGSGLTQSQSNSMNTGSGNGIGQSGKGNLVLSSANTLANQQFLMVGDDVGALTEQTTNVPAAINGSKRLTRTWMAQNTGSVGAVNLSFDMTGLTLTGGSTASNYRLMVNNTASSSDFTTGTQTYYVPASINGNLINFTGINLPNNAVFTLVSNYVLSSTNPGGISSNLYLWLNAGNGVTQTAGQVTTWKNLAATTMITQASTAGAGVSASNNIKDSNNSINYYPGIVFNGTSSYRLEGRYSAAPTNPPLMFAVAIGRTGSGQQQYACVYSSSNTIGGSTGMIYDAVHGEYWADYNGATCANTPSVYNVPSLVRLYYNNTTTANNAYIALNGTQQTSNACSSSDNLTAAQDSFQIGGRTWQGYLSRIFVGAMAEVIYYNGNTLSASQINQVESYLALKYGITLGSTASLVNYVSSNGTTFWTGNSTYQNDVFGIGMDNGSGLALAQSNSMNTGSGNGSGKSAKGNLVLSNSALTDQQFLMIGDDAKALTEQTTNLPSGSSGSKRLARNWLVRNTGSMGAVNLSFDMTGLTLSGGTTASNYRLLVNSNTDATFATGTPTHYYASSITGNLINFTGVSLNNNTVFTLVTYASGSTLPATWVSFTATKQGNGASLNWVTADEVNVGYYEVEQSTNGSSYLSLGNVAANNKGGTNNYSFQVGSLTDGPNYFRIKRVDLDGNFEYSNIRIINHSEGYSVSIEPNPIVGSTLRMRIVAPQAQKATVYIMGMDGRSLQNKVFMLEEGVNLAEMDLGHLAAGAYIARTLFANSVSTQKFIKE
ncbi:MAG: T9SS type A sorting domain-containing protein [Bacteroidetes bacterium]|nr:T9SS type A sorting domain-containing protein [Bacteroidota bacterium]